MSQVNGLASKPLKRGKDQMQTFLYQWTLEQCLEKLKNCKVGLLE